MKLSHLIELLWEAYVDGGNKDKKVYRVHRELLNIHTDIRKGHKNDDQERINRALELLLR